MKKLWLVIVGLAVVCFTAGPIIWQIITSVKPEGELVNLALILPSRITAEHYRAVLFETHYLRAVLNSVFVASTTTVLSLTFGALAAFSLEQLSFPGRNAVLGVSLLASMFPAIALISPLFLVISSIGLRDSLFGLILVDSAFATPLAIWVLSDSFRALPKEIYYSARIDGCSNLQVLFRIIIPMAWPNIIAAGILVFLFTWNEFLFALTFTNSVSTRTVPVAIALFPGLHEIPWGEISAASTIALIPALVGVVFFQRKIVAGLQSGAVKG